MGCGPSTVPQETTIVDARLEKKPKGVKFTVSIEDHTGGGVPLGKVAHDEAFSAPRMGTRKQKPFSDAQEHRRKVADS